MNYKKIIFILLLSLFITNLIRTNSFAELQIKNVDQDLGKTIEEGIGLASADILDEDALDEEEKNIEIKNDNENKDEKLNKNIEADINL